MPVIVWTQLILKVLVFQKRVRRSEHARKETEFLRLKRTRLGLEDFESLKVIGRGAFGEVHFYFLSECRLWQKIQERNVLKDQQKTRVTMECTPSDQYLAAAPW